MCKGLHAKNRCLDLKQVKNHCVGYGDTHCHNTSQQRQEQVRFRFTDLAHVSVQY
eukprot:m.36822 g.36822  ORF g.36822 m.36822 type:complete len:55 (+) comp14531_c0_seq2:348-512(+)